VEKVALLLLSWSGRLEIAARNRLRVMKASMSDRWRALKVTRGGLTVVALSE
jgi:hypothetical protein